VLGVVARVVYLARGKKKHDDAPHDDDISARDKSAKKTSPKIPPAGC